MAKRKKIVVAQLDIDLDALIKKQATYLEQQTKMRESQKLLKKETNNLNTANEKQRKTYAETDAQLKKVTTNYNQQKAVLSEATTGVKSLSDALNKENKTIEASRNNNKELIKLRSKVNTKTKEGKVAIEQINTKLDKNNKAIKENVSNLERQKINIGNYGSALDKILPGTSAFISNISGGTKALRSSVGGLKAFKLALAATGIGLIVIALAAFVAWLTQTQKGADALSDVLKVIGTIVNVLVNRLASLGSALVKVFKGDFKGAAEDAKGAFVGFNEQMREAIQNTLDLERAQRKLELTQQRLITIGAAQKVTIQELLLISRDLINETSTNRLRALEDAFKIQGSLNELAQQAADDALKIAQDQANKERLEQGEVTRLQLRALREAEATTINVKAEGLAKLRELKNRIVTENAVFEREETERVKEELNARTQEEVDITIEKNALLLEDEKELKLSFAKLERDQTENLRTEAETRKKISDEEFEAKMTNLQATQFLLRQGVVLAGRGTVAFKLLAITQAGVATYLAAAKALKDVPTPLNFAAAATVLGIGLGFVNSIRNIVYKPPRGFAKGTTSVPGEGSSDNVHSLLTPKERVVDVANNRRIGFDMTNDQLGNAAQMYRSFMNDQQGMTDKGIIGEIKALNKTLKNKPVSNTSVHVTEGYTAYNRTRYLS